jgi:23S rRNA pseudouridine2605 synthase
MKSSSTPRHGRVVRHGTGLARALSKLGYCSRSQARAFIAAGRVDVNGVTEHDPEWQVDLERDRIRVDQQAVRKAAGIYLMLNKPRGLVTTVSDEQGRKTVLDCLTGEAMPFAGPVGRLDKASEGLLLFTNDTAWAARILDPERHVEKVYHVQVNRLADETLVDAMSKGVSVEGDLLAATRVRFLRQGTRNSWLEVALTEGKNRHIRRLLAALGIEVLRLVRVSIGGLPLGNLEKGKYRRLTDEEIRMLA